MKNPFLNVMAAVSLLTGATLAVADNELVLNAYKDGEAASGLTVKLDGDIEKPLDNNGFVEFDLTAGSHSIQLIDNGKAVHSFRFSSAAGQYADINVALDEGKKPKVSVESYFTNETPAERLQAKKGSVVGKIRVNGFPVVGAQIDVTGTKFSAETDKQGNYTLELPRGIYQLTISHPAYGSKDVHDFRVVSHTTKGSDFSIGQLSQQVEEVVVKAKVNLSAMEESERYSVNVIDTMGVEELSRFSDTDVAAAVVRVPSITVQDSKYLFIRGLGGRYITTALNGSTLPSTDPAKRTVPLDLFPSNIVSQLDIKKTFIASMPGESTGGNLVINTRTFPNEQSGKLSVSFGYVDGLTGDDVLSDSTTGDFDFFGWDDGTREEDVTIKAIALALSSDYDDYVTDDVRTQLSRSAALLMTDDLDLDTKTAKPDVSLSANYGDVYELDTADLGFFIAGNFKNGWSKKDEGIDRSLSVSGKEINDDYVFSEYTNTVEASGLISIGLTQGDSTYQSNTVVSRVTESRSSEWVGTDGDALVDAVFRRVRWEERQFISQQFTGEHFIDEEGDLTADWQVTFSQAQRLLPDEREASFLRNGPNGSYTLVVPETIRRFEDLVDDNFDFSTDFTYLLDASGDGESNLQFGVQSIIRERDSDSATYGFEGGSSVDDTSPNILVSDVINRDNITGDLTTGLGFANKTQPSDSYEAELDLNSAYVSYDKLFSNEYQIIVGARYEDFEQTIDTFELSGDMDPTSTTLSEDIVLPSLSFNWFYREDEQVRAAITQTVSRPDFKEMSFATFYDKENNIRVRGNPNLAISKVDNFDVRWEKYWSDTESLSIALFYKDIKDPIERVELVASGTASDSRTYQNSDAAELYGIEFDGRKDFSLNEGLTKSVFVALNMSWIESEVDVDDSQTRALQGQADYTFNFIVGYDDIENDHELTLLFNQVGESIEDVGLAGRPNIIEEPRLDVKVTYKYYLDDNFVFKAKISNLLDSEVEFTQGGKIVQSRKEGREFQAGVEWSF